MHSNIIKFHNIGNSCYLNSALQCFVNIDNVNKYINNLLQRDISNPLLYQYLQIIHNSNKTSNPIHMKQILASKNSLFKNLQQQDCHECLIILMDIFHESTKHIQHNDLTPYYQSIANVNNELFKKKVTDANNQWKKFIKTFGYSFITHLFTGQFVTTLYCEDCGVEKCNFESFNNISLDIPKLKKDGRIVIPNVKHCFSKYFKEEDLDCEIDCDTCKTRTQMSKRTSIWRFPTILVLSLKRYLNPIIRNNSIIKIDKVIKFEIQSNKQILIYDLKCIVNHQGSSAYSWSP